MLRLSTWVMPGVLAGLLSGGILAMADSPAPPPGTTESKTIAAAPLTDETLLQMLRGLGFEPENVGAPDGRHKIYRIKLNRDGWNFVLDVQISSDQKVLWVQAYLGQIPATDQIQSEVLVTVLKLNAGGMGKAKFVITTKGELYLWKPVDNVAITPARLRNEMENLAATIKETAPHWKTGRWTVEGKKGMIFQEKVETLYGKVRAAYQDFYKELNPVYDGQPVDQQRLKQAHAKLLSTIREVRDSLNGLDKPGTPAAREMLEGYLRVLDVEEAAVSGEFAEIVRLVEDGKMNASQRVAKIRALLDQQNKKEEGVFKSLGVSYDNFRKHYGNI